MSNILGFECIDCRQRVDFSPSLYVCPSCGGNLDVEYDYAAIADQFSPATLATDPDATIRRWLPLLPIKSVDSLPALDIGGSPLYHARHLGDRLGLSHLYLKDDGRNPTASFKDLASAVAVAVGRERGAQVITTASSGNAGAALAGCCAAAAVRSVIFVPHTAPKPKIAQLLLFGADVYAVKGTYDQAFDLCLEASRLYGWYNRNTGYNPYTREGKKTCALEIAEQMRFTVPDKVFVAVGDGNIISGLWKGFRDLLAMGWTDRLPQMFGIQAAGSAPLVTAWETNQPLQPVDAHTIADSISVGLPRDGQAALRAVRETSGRFLSVTDDEILEAMRTLPRYGAVFAEPAGATGFAGLVKANTQGIVLPSERVVVVVTGNGLKDVENAVRAGGQPISIEPTVQALKQAFG